MAKCDIGRHRDYVTFETKSRDAGGIKGHN